MPRDFVDSALDSGVRDERVLAALRAVDRGLFVPADAGDSTEVNAPVLLPCQQTTSQPSLIAVMIEALELRPGSRVLEVGTGYGYEAALLSTFAAEVWTVEWYAELADAAVANLAAAGITNVHVVTGDGRGGLPEHAPYDGIVVAAQTFLVPPSLAEQLVVGGRLVAPVGRRDSERCLVLRKEADGSLVVERDLGRVRFVPLLGN